MSAAVEFQVWAVKSDDEVEFCSQVSGPREEALRDAHHYAMQVVADGDIAVIEEVTRVEVARITPLTVRGVGVNKEG